MSFTPIVLLFCIFSCRFLDFDQAPFLSSRRDYPVCAPTTPPVDQAGEALVLGHKFVTMDGAHLYAPDNATIQLTLNGKVGRYKGAVDIASTDEVDAHEDEGSPLLGRSKGHSKRARKLSQESINGVGSFASQDGYVYSGEWKQGHPDGEGVETDTDGIERRGVWKDGKLQVATRYGVHMSELLWCLCWMRRCSAAPRHPSAHVVLAVVSCSPKNQLRAGRLGQDRIEVHFWDRWCVRRVGLPSRSGSICAYGCHHGLRVQHAPTASFHHDHDHVDAHRAHVMGCRERTLEQRFNDAPAEMRETLVKAGYTIMERHILISIQSFYWIGLGLCVWAGMEWPTHADDDDISAAEVVTGVQIGLYALQFGIWCWYLHHWLSVKVQSIRKTTFWSLSSAALSFSNSLLGSVGLAAEIYAHHPSMRNSAGIMLMSTIGQQAWMYLAVVGQSIFFMTPGVSSQMAVVCRADDVLSFQR